jgi:hypothetical protein
MQEKLIQLIAKIDASPLVPDGAESAAARATLEKVRADLATARGELDALKMDTVSAHADLLADRIRLDASIAILSEREAAAVRALCGSRVSDLDNAVKTFGDAVSASSRAITSCEQADALVIAPMFGGDVRKAGELLKIGRGWSICTTNWQNARRAHDEAYRDFSLVSRVERDCLELRTVCGLRGAP